MALWRMWPVGPIYYFVNMLSISSLLLRSYNITLLNFDVESIWPWHETLDSRGKKKHRSLDSISWKSQHLVIYSILSQKSVLVNITLQDDGSHLTRILSYILKNVAGKWPRITLVCGYASLFVLYLLWMLDFIFISHL